VKKVTYESWLTELVGNLQEYFNLSGWRILLKFSDKEEKEGTYAENEVVTPYMFSTITFYKSSRKNFKSGDIDFLVMAVVHEMVHIFLDPFNDYMHPHLSLTTTPLFMNSLEQQTQKLTTVFLKTLPKSIIPPLR